MFFWKKKLDVSKWVKKTKIKFSWKKVLAVKEDMYLQIVISVGL